MAQVEASGTPEVKSAVILSCDTWGLPLLPSGLNHNPLTNVAPVAGVTKLNLMSSTLTPPKFKGPRPRAPAAITKPFVESPVGLTGWVNRRVKASLSEAPGAGEVKFSVKVY